MGLMSGQNPFPHNVASISFALREITEEIIRFIAGFETSYNPISGRPLLKAGPDPLTNATHPLTGDETANCTSPLVFLQSK
jgi:hypothetical protein